MEFIYRIHKQLGPELVHRLTLYVCIMNAWNQSSNCVAVIIFPFFILNRLKLRKRQKIALCGVFSLGFITVIISLGRFIVYTVTDYNVDDATGSESSSTLRAYGIID